MLDMNMGRAIIKIDKIDRPCRLKTALEDTVVVSGRIARV
jgi:hypothetical protein